MQDIVFSIAGTTVTGWPLVAGMALALLVAGFVGAALARAGGGESDEAHERLEALQRAQEETAVRLKTMAEIFGSRQSDLARALTDRLDGLGHRLGQTMNEGTQATHENLRRLAERLAVIDKAERTIGDLTGHVRQLERIFADKQSRGAFGQGRMEAIVRDGLPEGTFAFQATLSNGTRPDCVVRLPNGQPVLVIDAKFPLEAWSRVRAADNAEAAKAAEGQFRRDVMKHVDDLRARYQIPGETQDTTLLFIPSESLFAELHERYEDVVAKALAGRVVFVSPSLLMLSIQLVQSILRDERMREQAHLIQSEVRKLVEDIVRLDERVRALGKHFGQVTNDIDQIVISTDKIARRGNRLESLEVDDGRAERGTLPSEPAARRAL